MVCFFVTASHLPVSFIGQDWVVIITHPWSRYLLYHWCRLGKRWFTTFSRSVGLLFISNLQRLYSLSKAKYTQRGKMFQPRNAFFSLSFSFSRGQYTLASFQHPSVRVVRQSYTLGNKTRPPFCFRAWSSFFYFLFHDFERPLRELFRRKV